MLPSRNMGLHWLVETKVSGKALQCLRGVSAELASKTTKDHRFYAASYSHPSFIPFKNHNGLQFFQSYRDHYGLQDQSL